MDETLPWESFPTVMPGYDIPFMRAISPSVKGYAQGQR